MKVIFENMKNMILPTIVVIGIFVLLMTVAFPAIKHQSESNQNTRKYSDYQDCTVYQNVSQREAPVITYDSQKIWKVGNTIPIGQAFQAKDADGNVVELRVMNIEDVTGISMMDKYEENGKTAVFDTAGSYYFRLKAVDQEKKTTIKTIALVVDN